MFVISSQLFESMTPGHISAAIVALTIGSLIIDFAWKPRYPKSLPRVGFGDGFLGTLKNWFYMATRYNAWVAEGHEKVRTKPASSPARLTRCSTVFQGWTRLRRAVIPEPPARDRRTTIPDGLDARAA